MYNIRERKRLLDLCIVTYVNASRSWIKSQQRKRRSNSRAVKSVEKKKSKKLENRRMDISNAVDARKIQNLLLYFYLYLLSTLRWEIALWPPMPKMFNILILSKINFNPKLYRKKDYPITFDISNDHCQKRYKKKS